MALENKKNLTTVAVATASPEKFANTIFESIKNYQEVNIEGEEEFIELDLDFKLITDSIKKKFS